jgi:hypothetical protein
MQGPSYCEKAVLHFSAPCRTLPTGSSTTRVAEYSGFKRSCTVPQGAALLDIAGKWSAHNVTLPLDGFNCSCPCGTDIMTALGSIDVLIRAVDRKPNYKHLPPQCTPTQPVYQGQLYVAECDSTTTTRQVQLTERAQIEAVLACPSTLNAHCRDHRQDLSFDGTCRTQLIFKQAISWRYSWTGHLALNCTHQYSNCCSRTLASPYKRV